MHEPVPTPLDHTREKIVIVEADPALRGDLDGLMQSAGYDVASFVTTPEALDALHQHYTDVLLLDSNTFGAPIASVHETLAAIRSSTATQGIRIILLVDSSTEERTAALDLGADDALSRPWDGSELMARVRSQLRARRTENQLLDKMHIAEEGQQMAHTAFEALAVTEKMSSDASSLDRRLKIGLGAALVIAIFMAGIYFLFVRSAQKQTLRSNAVIARLEGGLVSQQTLMAEARRLRGIQQGGLTEELPGKEQLRAQSAELKAKLATAASADELANLKDQLADTDARLKRVERQGDSAQSIIPADVESVCLLHVSVAFRNTGNGRRLHYAGLNPQGEPIQDSDGHPIFTLDGPGPEVKLDVFGTGFVAGADGKVITNRHVAEPWWNNDELASLTGQGFQAEISTIRAYFPG